LTKGVAKDILAAGVRKMNAEDLTRLRRKDLQDVFKVIRSANCCLEFSEMRRRLVRTLKHAFRADGVVLFLPDRESKAIDNTRLVSEGLNLHYLEPWVRKYRYNDPFQQEMESRRTVCKVDDILPYRRWVGLKIYKEFYRPQNIHYKLSISLRSKTDVYGLIGIFRPREERDFSAGEMAKARILAPHLATALENNLRFSRIDESKRLLTRWCDGVPSFGTIILDYDLRPAYWNASAGEFCRLLGSEDLSGHDGEDVGSIHIPHELLHDCITLKESFRGGSDLASLRRQRAIKGAPNRRFEIVSSLVEDSFGEQPHLKFVIYLLDFSEVSESRQEALKQRYGLTNREIDVVNCVCQGLTNDEIGERLFISRFTVETHLKNIFDKTRIRNRTGVAGLVQTL
jgi:DNA-binding CsgD family transcriptional regulator